MNRLRIAAKYFTLGLLIGIACAPRRGSEFREQLLAKIPGRGRLR
jgi:hypothetical protein